MESRRRATFEFRLGLRSLELRKFQQQRQVPLHFVIFFSSGSDTLRKGEVEMKKLENNVLQQSQGRIQSSPVKLPLRWCCWAIPVVFTPPFFASSRPTPEHFQKPPPPSPSPPMGPRPPPMLLLLSTPVFEYHSFFSLCDQSVIKKAIIYLQRKCVVAAIRSHPLFQGDLL